MTTLLYECTGKVRLHCSINLHLEGAVDCRAPYLKLLLKLSHGEEAWNKTIGKAGPFDYFFTLSFVRRYSDMLAIKAARAWVSMTNMKLSGPAWRRAASGMKGVVVAERHKRSDALQGTLHFHFLICHIPAGDVNQVQSEFTSKALVLKDQNGNQMSDSERIRFVPIHSEPDLINYLTKQIHIEWDCSGDNITFVNNETGMDDFCFRKSGPRW